MPPPARHGEVEKDQTEAVTETDYRDRYENLTGHSLRQCPQCRQGNMVVVQILPRCSASSRQSWIPHDPQHRFRTCDERVLVVRHHRRSAHVSRIRPLSFADQADNPAIGGHSHISNGPCAHVPRPHAPSAPLLAEGNGPFKTHRPNCRGAVQSNPSLAHRRGVQDFLSPDESVAAPPT